jgi:activator of HSP90 ATPase
MAAPIHHEVQFAATPETVYEALADSQRHAAFTGAPADISRDAGGMFSTHGGVITGRVIELARGKRIVQAWRVKGWEEGVYSIVRYELQARGGGTMLILDHAGFPEGERDHLDSGWKTMYWEPLKKYLSS